MTERDDILESLTTHRGFLLRTVDGLSDEQARQRTTVSELTLGGLVKHVALMEQQWVEFVLDGPGTAMQPTPEAYAAFTDGFSLHADETLEGSLTEYAKIAGRTDELVRTVPDFDGSQPLPETPWFAPGARRSARRVFLHLVGEIAQHAGHADIIRESLDGQKTMG